MRRNTIGMDEIKKLSSAVLRDDGYEYAWVQRTGSVKIGSLDEAGLDASWDDVWEARIFNQTKEMHIFRYGEELAGAIVECQDGDEFIDESQMLRKSFGKSIKLRSFIDYDVDGQAFIACTVLTGYEKGEGNG